MASATPNLEKIAVGKPLESDEICWAMREIKPAAEQWVGRDIELECNTSGWHIRYTSGNGARALLDHCGYRFTCAEDAIEALVKLIAQKKGQAERDADDAA